MLTFNTVSKMVDSQTDLGEIAKAKLTSDIMSGNDRELKHEDEIINQVLYKVITECDSDDDAESFLRHIIDQLTRAKNTLK